MEPWYAGAVVDAVREAKTRQALFIVYVRDDSEQSQSTDQLWSTTWTSLTDTKKIVALRLDKDTEACTQFMAIYKVQLYPTIYLINGQNGQILKKIDHPLDTAHQLENIVTESLNIVNPSTAEATASSQSTKTVDEKVNEARARLKELHEKREAEAKEKEKEEEVARRRLGQQMLLDKQKKNEESIRKQAEDIRQDRLEQQKLQEKLKAQIQQDREDKRRKFEQGQADAAPKPKPKVTTTDVEPPQVTYTRCRLQFRLTDGSFFTEDFSCDAHMNDVYAYLQETLPANQYSHGSYVLRTTHTRTTLARDNTSTLKELELVPSAVLLVIHRGGGTSSPPSSSNLTPANLFQPISLFFAWLMMQVSFLYQLISTKLFGTPTASAAARPTPQRTNPSNQTKKTKENFTTDSTASSTIRRFRNTQDDSDDEEKRTWNGNSTEQM